MPRPGIEPRTSCIPGRRANHYTTAVFRFCTPILASINLLTSLTLFSGLLFTAIGKSLSVRSPVCPVNKTKVLIPIKFLVVYTYVYAHSCLKPFSVRRKSVCKQQYPYLNLEIEHSLIWLKSVDVIGHCEITSLCSDNMADAQEIYRFSVIFLTLFMLFPKIYHIRCKDNDQTCLFQCIIVCRALGSSLNHMVFKQSPRASANVNA